MVEQNNEESDKKTEKLIQYHILTAARLRAAGHEGAARRHERLAKELG